MKLEIGSGFNPHPGYTHLDLNGDMPCVEIVADARKIPLDDNSVEKLVAYHVLEHFMWHEGENILREWCRVIKPNGIIELGLPNLDNILKIYNCQDDSWKNDKGLNLDSQPYNAGTDKWELLNHLLWGSSAKYNQHHAGWTYDALEKRLRQVGFVDIKQQNPEFTHLTVTAKKG